MIKWYPLLIVIFLLLSGCTFASEKSGQFTRESVQLVKPIDGDTIEILYKGTPEKVRLLLIDTPETSHPRLGEQPYGQEAKAYTRSLVEGAKKIELEFDIGPKRDKYSRLLAYVYVDGKMLQEELLESGLARVAYIYPPNTRYVDQFREIQEESRMNEYGIWEIENYSTEDGFNPEVIENSSAKDYNSTSGNCDIKGNINSKGEKIYHTTDSPWYKQTKPELWFCSEQEASLAGFRAPK